MSTIITKSFNTTVQNNVLNIDVPTPISLESGLTYVFRQFGNTSTSGLSIKIRRGGVTNDLTETAITGTNEFNYKTSLSPTLEVSYHVFNANGTTSRVTYDSYASTLTALGNGYLKLVVPNTLDATDTIVLTTALGTNYFDFNIINQKVRVKTGDYLWVEIEQQKRATTGSIWTDNYVQTPIADRLIFSVDLQHDESISESDLA